MTEISRYLLGLVAITGFPVLYYLLLTLRAQIKAEDFSWRDSAPTRLAGSMVLLGVTLALFITSALIAKTTQPSGISNYLVWSGWFTCWCAEMMALSGLRRGAATPTFVANLFWTIGFLIWQGFLR